MKATLPFRTGLVEKAIGNVWQLLPIILSAMKTQKKMLIGILLSPLFFSISFSTPGIKIPGEKKIAVERLTLINADKDVKKAGGVPGQATILWDKTFGGIPTPGSQDDRWGGDRLKSVIPTVDGGYLLAGHSSSNINGDKSESCRGANDYWVIKIGHKGNKLWDKTFGGDIFDELTNIVPSPDGGYLLAGYSFSGVSGDKTAPSKGAEDYWVVKIDSKGNKLWDKAFGGNGADRLSSAISIPGGGYLLGGFSMSNASGDKSQNNKGGVTDYWIVRIDNQGNKIWDRTFGGDSDDNLSSVTLTPDGFLLGGSSLSGISGDKSENSKGSYDFWVLKIDKQGNKVWDKTIGGTGMDILAATTLAHDGGYLLAGNASVVKIDGVGNTVWDKNYGGTHDEQFTSVVSVPGGGYLLAGALFSDVSGSDFWVTKIDNQGNKAWDKTLGGNGFDFATCTIVVRNGNYLVAGYSNSNISGDKTENSKGGFDYWIVALKAPATSVVTSLTQMNARTDQAIKELKDGDVINARLQVAVYPLPASGVINITHEGKTEQAHMILLDFNGNVLLNRPLSQEPVEQLDVSAFRKGIHYLKVVSSEGVQIIRLVLE